MLHTWLMTCTQNLLQMIGVDETWSVCSTLSESGMFTLKISRALVLFFFDLASPMRCSTSALRSFRIPMQSTLHSHPQQLPVTLNTHIHIHMCTCETCKCTCIHHFNSHFLGKSALAWFCISKYSSNDQRLRCHSSQHCSCTPQIRTLY